MHEKLLGLGGLPRKHFFCTIDGVAKPLTDGAAESRVAKSQADSGAMSETHGQVLEYVDDFDSR